MFERFTEDSRQVVITSHAQAKTRRRDQIGTEHVLLAVIGQSEGEAAKVLEALHISLQDVHRRLDEIIGTGDVEPTGHIPFSPAAKKVFEFGLAESQELGDEHIGTEHLLLGLIREGEGVAGRLLIELGADLSRVRRQITA